mmetsp:Transcript_17605/g.28817  ORF Transcript_17605/g.28817 Transcript_17605/m.28817 type:complete len:91 (+) Transcript_17605:179-451(+)
MESLSNFLLNTFAAVVELATRDPDVQQLHDSIDALSSRRYRNDTSVNRDSPKSNGTNAAAVSNSSSSKRKAAGKDLLSMFYPKPNPNPFL